MSCELWVVVELTISNSDSSNFSVRSEPSLSSSLVVSIENFMSPKDLKFPISLS